MKIFLVVMLAVGAGSKKKAPPPPPAPLTEPSARVTEAVGEKTAAMLQASSKVMVYRVTGQPGVRPNPSLAVGVDFERHGEGRELSEDEMKKLKSLLYDARSFKLEKPPSCGDFKPDVAFLGTTEDDTGALEMLVSFKCSGVMFFTAKTAGRSLPGAQLDFKPARKPLLAMVKELLAGEPAVQSLK